MSVKKFSDFPRKFGSHVIMDTRSGALFYSQVTTPLAAMAEVVFSMGPEEFESLPEADRDAASDEAMSELMGMTFGVGPQRSPYSVVNIGPYETTAGTLDRKNMDYILTKFHDLVHGGAVITDEDHEAARWLGNRLEGARVQYEQQEARRSAGEAEALGDIMERIFRAAARRD